MIQQTGELMDLIKLENDIYEIIFILSEYLTKGSPQYIKNNIIRSPLQKANDILFQFVEKLDLVIEQEDMQRDTESSEGKATPVRPAR